MKKTIIAVLVILLVAGCVSSQQQTNQSVGTQNVSAPPNATQNSSINVADNGNVQVIGINAINTSGGLRFILQNYTGEFVSVGFYSDSFLVLNSSQISFLDENESIWLTPLIRGNRTMLFNAIYVRDINDCNPTLVTILGKQYPINSLTNNTIFGSDSKWKTVWDEQGGCKKRLIVYMNGYYANLNDGDEVNLFRNDNTILLKMNRNQDGQRIDIIATKPSG